MRCKLVLDDWRQLGNSESIYGTPLGWKLSLGDLHSGTTFDVEVRVSEDVEEEIIKAMQDHGAYPVFRLLVER